MAQKKRKKTKTKMMKKMVMKRERMQDLSIPHVVRIKLFPRGIARLCGTRLFETQLKWYLAEVERRIRNIGKRKKDPGGYICIDEPRPEHGPGCVQEVCYDENGLVISMGPIRCPPVPRGG